MQLALGRLQFSVVMAPRVTARRPATPEHDTSADDALERAFHREQRLQAIEIERVHQAQQLRGSVGSAPSDRRRGQAGLPDDWRWLDRCRHHDR